MPQNWLALSSSPAIVIAVTACQYDGIVRSRPSTADHDALARRCASSSVTSIGTSPTAATAGGGMAPAITPAWSASWSPRRGSGSRKILSAKPIPNGIHMKNAARHPQWSTSTPPKANANIAPSNDPPAYCPSLFARSTTG
jgi:hypothetical protein